MDTEAIGCAHPGAIRSGGDEVWDHRGDRVDPDLTSSHECTESTATYGTLSSEKETKRRLSDSYTSSK